VLFDDASEIGVLDAARGSLGDPADDVTCMAINYVFFAVEQPHAWRAALGELWRRFWQVYLDESGDLELCDVVAPFLAWRGLVVANPVWYPEVEAQARDRVLALIERTLDAERFDPSFAEELFP
jgi:aminoglycoside phosphotransferase (APT) family kinase protein